MRGAHALVHLLDEFVDDLAYGFSSGFCEKTRRVAFISILGIENVYEFAKPFVVRDVHVNEECEDGKYCWNPECPHNRATPQTLKKYLGKNCDPETFKIVSERLQKIGKHFVSEIDWAKDETTAYKKAPIAICRKRKRETG